MKLPELPPSEWHPWGAPVYTASQMREYAEAVREACARVCEREAWGWDEQRPFAKVAHDCAAAIRRKEE